MGEKTKIATAHTKGDLIGHSVSIDGDYAVVGIPNSGRGTTGDWGPIAIHKRDSTDTWVGVSGGTASDKSPYSHFGSSVCISNRHIIVGAPGPNAVYFFELDSTGNWVETQKFSSNQSIGNTVSIAGDYAIVGAPEANDTLNQIIHAGAAYIFERDSTGQWVKKQELMASDRTSALYHLIVIG